MSNNLKVAQINRYLTIIMENIKKFIIFTFVFYAFSCTYYTDYKLSQKFRSAIHPTDPIFTKQKTQFSFTPKQFNEISQLYYLCKIWGFVKYYHENDSNIVVDVDQILSNSLIKMEQCSSKEAFQDLILTMIDSIQISPLNGKNPHPDTRKYYLIDNEWMNDTICLNPVISERLKNLFLKHSGKNNLYICNLPNTGRILLLREKNYTSSCLEERIKLLSLFRYWNLIYYFYVYKNYIDENWDNVLYETIPRFLSATTEKNYHEEIAILTNKLKDTHTSFPISVDSILFGMNRACFRMMNINNTFVINEIRFANGTRSNFQAGDIVLEINNQNVIDLYDRLKNYIGGGNHWSEQMFVCNAMLSFRDTLSHFKILRENDTLTLQSRNRHTFDLSDEKMKHIIENESSNLTQWINDSIAYWNIESVTPQNFKKNYNKIKKAKTIILDMRCYPDNRIILNFSETFVPPNSNFVSLSYPDSHFPGMVRSTGLNNTIGNKNYYKGKILLLVDCWTQSFSEYLTMSLQANPNTVTIGYSTSGADGNVLMVDFPCEVQSCFSSIGIYYPDKQRTQRCGIRIDYTEEPTIGKIKAKNDFILDKAIEIATH
jgi:C-terminal processing protease CtpA/Prc